MRNLILIFARHNSLILFIGLEILCFYLVVNFNSKQRAIFINSSNIFSSRVLEQKQKLNNYLNLEEINDSLIQANAYLLKRLIQLEGYGEQEQLDPNFSIDLIPSKLVNQTIHLQNNTFTIDKGKIDGVRKGMGIISHNGIVGILTNTSDNFAQGISILNSNMRISASIRNKNFFGNLLWDGNDPLHMTLEAIPKHANIAIGDTVVTSGYSSIFPSDMIIGYIDHFEVRKGRSNYTITVRLNNDPSNLKYVYVVVNMDYSEKTILESSQG